MNVYLHIEDIPHTDKTRVTLVADRVPHQVRTVKREDAYGYASELLDEAFGKPTGQDTLQEIQGESGALYVPANPTQSGDLMWKPSENNDLAPGA